MNSNNINNEQQYCKGCEKNFPSSSFTNNGKSYRTCNTCHTQIVIKIMKFNCRFRL